MTSVPGSNADTPRQLPLFPLHVVLFPGMRLPLHIFEDRYKLMVGTCMVTDQTFGVALIRSGREVGGPAEIHPVGTTARILQIDRLPEGRMNLVVIGVQRFRLLDHVDGQPYAVGTVQLLPERETVVPAGLTAHATRRFRRYLLGRGASADQVDALELPEAPSALSFLIAAAVKAPSVDRQRLLEAATTELRLRRELSMLEWAAGGPTDQNARSFSLN